jgi:hypothetical protein
MGTTSLSAFSDLVNLELMWAATAVLSEANLTRRVAVAKHLVRIASECGNNNNFNSMFAIVAGLGHASVARLRYGAQ